MPTVHFKLNVFENHLSKVCSSQANSSSLFGTFKVWIGHLIELQLIFKSTWKFDFRARSASKAAKFWFSRSLFKELEWLPNSYSKGTKRVNLIFVKLLFSWCWGQNKSLIDQTKVLENTKYILMFVIYFDILCFYRWHHKNKTLYFSTYLCTERTFDSPQFVYSKTFLKKLL